MIGTIVNTATVLSGSLIGLAAGKRLPERIKKIRTGNLLPAIPYAIMGTLFL